MIKLTDGRRLIDADDLIEVLLETRREEIETTPKLVRFIEKRPTIEPKHGRWIEDDNGDTVCSNCGKREIEFVYGTENWYGVGASNYCPNCGAKMEAE